MTKGDFMKAAGVIPWKEGDELPEDVIRRMRDSEGEVMPDYLYDHLLRHELIELFEETKATADRRGRLLEEIKFLMTSMQENWREQYLFDIYDLIAKELADETR